MSRRSVLVAKSVVGRSLLVGVLCVLSGGRGFADSEHLETIVLPVTQVPASRIAAQLRAAFPAAKISVDQNSNSLIVRSTDTNLAMIRSVEAGLDTRNPLAPVIASYSLAHFDGARIAGILRGVYPEAHVVSASRNLVVVSAPPTVLTQVQTFIAAVDVAPNVPTAPAPSFDTLDIDYGDVRRIAHTVATTVRGVSVKVSGSHLLLAGPSENVEQAKRLATALDQPTLRAVYPQVYELHHYDAHSVGNLLRQTFPNIRIAVGDTFNAVTVIADAPTQRRIHEAIAELENEAAAAPGGAMGAPGGGSGANDSIVIYTLKAALPGTNGGNSTSATDLAATVMQVLNPIAPDLHITPVTQTQRLILTGSAYSLSLAKDLLNRLDVTQDLVILDVKIYEVDETAARDLGVSLPTPVVGTTFSEVTPVANSVTGITPRLAGLQPIQRTALSLPAQLSLMVQDGSAKVLADPRITTISGRAATIRAGDTISVQTTAGGGAGTVATTQLQTFQTGVSLDITPVINTDGFVSVTLHPTVNSETGILNGIPQIATRDTQTTVAMHEDQTLIIGGLIQESTTDTVNKIPVLSSLPLVGKVFSEHQHSYSRNELVITVTPHIVRAPDGTAQSTPSSLPTVPPGTRFAETTDASSTMNSGMGANPPSPPNQPSGANSRVWNAPQTVAQVPSMNGAPLFPQSTVTMPPLTSMPTPMPAMPVGAVPAPIPTAPAGALGTQGTPNPTASSLANVNRYTWGTPPQNNFAKPTDALQIDYVTFSPTVVKAGDQITINAVTTTNATQVLVQLDSSQSKSLMQNGPGQWSGTFSLSDLSSSLPTPPTNLTLTLKALKGGDGSAMVPLPISLTL